MMAGEKLQMHGQAECRSVFLLLWIGHDAPPESGALWQVARGCANTRPLRLLDSPFAE